MIKRGVSRGPGFRLWAQRAKGKTMSQQLWPTAHPALAPFSLGVCSWSLQVKSIPELKGLLDQLGVNVVQIACGDPHHASWNEGESMPMADRKSVV